MIFGAANGVRVEFGVVAFVCFRCRCGLRRGACLFMSWVARIGGTVPGMLFVVYLMWVQSLAPRVILFIGFVDVVTGGAVATLWAGCPTSEMGVSPNLWFNWACVSVAILPRTLVICFSSLDLASGFMLWIEYTSSSYTSFACCSGVNSGNRQWCGNKSNDPENMSPFVSGMNHCNTL